jgi:23S rRNA (cytosine1962-C5)-methyltransferase
LLSRALQARQHLLDEAHLGGLRLFNGFYEGQPELVLELYARTLVIYDYAAHALTGEALVGEALAWSREALPWVECAILKTRRAPSEDDRRGQVIYGGVPARRMREHGVWYALDLQMNQDASIYLDTRLLRQWLLDNSRSKTALNAFAYTGSLGVAAAAGGASQVVQIDRNRRFLNLAKDSYLLNGLPIDKSNFRAQDFWVAAARLRRARETFDIALLDPPFFSNTTTGTVDLLTGSARLINKIRPLVKHGGHLVAINNALFISGTEYMQALESLCADGYLAFEGSVPVPEDFTGPPETRVNDPPVDPAPFNHPTKIAILKVIRKN